MFVDGKSNDTTSLLPTMGVLFERLSDLRKEPMELIEH